jgi:hypothetical protein
MVGTPFLACWSAHRALGHGSLLADVLSQFARVVSPTARVACVQIELSEQVLEIRLARWEKVLGLMRDIRVARPDVYDARVVENPVREAMRGGMKAGLRIPWLLFVARTLRLEQVYIVRRGQPGLSFSVRNHEPLRSVLVSTARAGELAEQLRRPGG